MKTTITAAILAIAAATAAAQSSPYITTREGQITLTQTKCEDGRSKEAVMILNRPGGAYGCWTTTNDTIVIRWHTLIGARGDAIDADFVTKHPKN